jgi:hypothetical protein
VKQRLITADTTMVSRAVPLPTMSSDKANIMVFAPERVALIASGRIETRNFNISFEPLQSARRFDEYDGVVVFQRTFEDLECFSGEWNSGWRQKTVPLVNSKVAEIMGLAHPRQITRFDVRLA